MIKASALLVALAIGLLVAGVVGSSLAMVYVSIAVCAAAALILAAGVLSHWSEIFGRREARPAAPGAWSEPQVNVTAPVLASIQAVAAARGSGRPGREEAGFRPDGVRADDPRTVAGQAAGGRPPGAQPDGRRGPERPAEAAPLPAEVAGRGDEFPARRRSDDLWQRVEEELGSAAKRDTGALSWPGTVLPPIPPDLPEPAESAAPAPGAGPPGEPRAGASAWLWDSGARWQPPETADPAWPPPAAAFAEPQAAPESAEPASPELAEPEPAEPGPAEPEPAEPEPAELAFPAPAEPELDAPLSGRPGDAADAPVPDETTAGPAADAGVAQDADAAEGAGAALDDDAASDDAAADDHVVLSDDLVLGDDPDPDHDPDPGDGAVQGDGAVLGEDAVPDREAAEPAPERSGVSESVAEPPAADDRGADDPDADDPDAGEAAVKEPAAGEPVVREPGPGAAEPAAPEPSGDGAAAKPAPGRGEVTVVPGVSRYHRRECILIRFLGAGDLEIMTRQEAVDAKFMACRACQPDDLED